MPWQEGNGQLTQLCYFLQASLDFLTPSELHSFSLPPSSLTNLPKFDVELFSGVDRPSMSEGLMRVFELCLHLTQSTM